MEQAPVSTTQGSFQEILDLAVAIELECAGVYEVFAKRFTEDEDFSMFWRLYAEAERYHGASIRIHQATFGDEQLALSQFAAEADASRAFLDRLRGWRRDFEKRMPTRNEAFGIAKEIETHTAELHGRTQFFALYPRFEELFRRMVDEDLSHRDMLVDAERRFLVSA